MLIYAKAFLQNQHLTNETLKVREVKQGIAVNATFISSLWEIMSCGITVLMSLDCLEG